MTAGFLEYVKYALFSAFGVIACRHIALFLICWALFLMHTESAVICEKLELFKACGHKIRCGNLFQSIWSFLLNVKCEKLIIIIILIDYGAPNLLYSVHTETCVALLNHLSILFIAYSWSGSYMVWTVCLLPTGKSQNKWSLYTWSSSFTCYEIVWACTMCTSSEAGRINMNIS